ncbi:hypothetical protein GCM10022408_27580 [Hymenobacter fastidiosus]|uniref:Uncharacterized protein n=1 Tax=Hymenobacter fastidiosus TaxID=486264 RepID=A0ABP7SLF3_9BACT
MHGQVVEHQHIARPQNKSQTIARIQGKARVVERALEELPGFRSLAREQPNERERAPRLSGTACPTRCPPTARA